MLHISKIQLGHCFSHVYFGRHQNHFRWNKTTILNIFYSSTTIYLKNIHSPIKKNTSVHLYGVFARCGSDAKKKTLDKFHIDWSSKCHSQNTTRNFFLWIFWTSPKSISIKQYDNPKYYQVEYKSCALPPPHMLCVDNNTYTYFYSFYQCIHNHIYNQHLWCTFMVSCYLWLQCWQTLTFFMHIHWTR